MYIAFDDPFRPPFDGPFWPSSERRPQPKMGEQLTLNLRGGYVNAVRGGLVNSVSSEPDHPSGKKLLLKHYAKPVHQHSLR